MNSSYGFTAVIYGIPKGFLYLGSIPPLGIIFFLIIGLYKTFHFLHRIVHCVFYSKFLLLMVVCSSYKRHLWKRMICTESNLQEIHLSLSTFCLRTRIILSALFFLKCIFSLWIKDIHGKKYLLNYMYKQSNWTIP